MFSKKRNVIIIAVLAGIILILGLIWYYQSQGLVKIFPTSEDLQIRKALVIDRSKFTSPDGLTEQKKQEALAQLEDLKAKLQKDPKDATNWFTFGGVKDFFNDHEGAVVAWKIAFALQPLNYVAAGNIGNAYQYFLKDYPQSEFYYKKALEIKPDYTVVYQGLMDLYRFNYKEKRGDYEPLVLSAAKNDPANETKYYVALVDFYARDNNNLVKAKEYLKIVRNLSQSSADELVKDYPQLKQ